MASRSGASIGRPTLRDVSVEAVLDASPNPIVGIDELGRIVYVNPSTEGTFGYEAGELIGQPVEILIPASLASAHRVARDELLRSPVARPMGQAHDRDLAGRRKDGSEFPVDVSLAPVPTADGVRVFATVADISARKSAESQLLQAQKLESVGRLAGGIAHDFNNMMFAVRGYADLLRDELDPARDMPPDLAQAREFVDALDVAAERAASLTAQLLAFSRRQVVEARVVDVDEAVLGIEPMLRPLIGEHIALHLRLDPDAGRIRADPGQLDQIIVNLVVNARDALQAGGSITIGTAHEVLDAGDRAARSELDPGAYVTLSVSDDGSGMNAETLEHLFEPFFTTKDVGKGTGLGLATIHGIVRQAGGHVRVESEQGHGSTFTLFFPRVVGEPEPLADPDVVRPIATGRAVVVEDDDVVRGLTTQLLERAGLDVQVGTAVDAVAMASAGEPIDVIVSDVVLPGLSGLAVADAFLRMQPGTAVVLLSGYLEEGLELQELLERGAVFVSKPASATQLVDAIERARVAAAVRRTVDRTGAVPAGRPAAETPRNP
ncbi:MAG: ATP-binding protein [Chloroflexota bacterium]